MTLTRSAERRAAVLWASAHVSTGDLSDETVYCFLDLVPFDAFSEAVQS